MIEPSNRRIIRAEAQLMFANLPSVFYLYCSETKAESKYKYLVILSNDGSTAFYFMINSKSFFADGCEILVKKSELPCLIRDSYIDCRELFSIPTSELIRRIADNIDLYDRGPVPSFIKARMADAVNNARTLSKREKNIALDALGFPMKT